ncbi:hypothetical protein ACFRAU_07500 [Arthrobacter sp. NPDC056691]|uniref:hypothetical protein n=1 Tax=Arthrobacter sp. NPDC056691 TaxID=3345913 RepID=UPI00366B2BE3
MTALALVPLVPAPAAFPFHRAAAAFAGPAAEPDPIRSPASDIPPAARLLAEAFPQIVGFDATGMTAEEIHYFLGESAGVAYCQYQVLRGSKGNV